MLVFRPQEHVQIDNNWLVRNGLYLTYNMIFEKVVKPKCPGEIAFAEYRLPNVWQGGPVKSLLFFGGGGIGDRIQATPMLREVARRAECVVDACSVREALEWKGLPYIGNVGMDYPAKGWVEQYEACFSIEGVISEGNATECPRCKSVGVPLHQLFGNFVGVPVSVDAKPDYVILPGEERLCWLPAKGERKRIGMHMGKFSPARIWPAENWLALIQAFTKDYEVVLLGTAMESPSFQIERFNRHFPGIPAPYDNLIDYTGFTPNIRAMAVAMKTCDLFIGCDSAPLHLAGALDIPSVGLYGAFRYEIRGVNLPSILPIQIPAPPGDKWREEGGRPHTCADCFSHVQFGEALPCKQQFCDLMTGIVPEMVIGAAQGLLK